MRGIKSTFVTWESFLHMNMPCVTGPEEGICWGECICNTCESWIPLYICVCVCVSVYVHVCMFVCIIIINNRQRGKRKKYVGWLIRRVLSSSQFCIVIFICRMCQRAQILRTVSLQRVRSTGHQLPIHKISMLSCPAPSFARFWDRKSGEPISIISHSHSLATIISRTLMFYAIKPTKHMCTHLHFNLTYAVLWSILALDSLGQ